MRCLVHRHGDGIKGDRQFDEMDAAAGAAFSSLAEIGRDALVSGMLFLQN